MRIPVSVDAPRHLTIPAGTRRDLALRSGSRLWLSLEDGDLILRRDPQDTIAGLSGVYKGEPSPLDDLICEHAEEVRRDEELFGSPRDDRAYRPDPVSYALEAPFA